MTASYSVNTFGSRCKIAIRGPLTSIVIPELQGVLEEQLQLRLTELVFDLKHANMLDSSGIGLLIATSNRLSREGATLRVINPSNDVFRLLSSMRLIGRLRVQPAMEALSLEDEQMLQESQAHLSQQDV